MKKISICGLDCGSCPAYLAYQHDDDDLRKKTAKQWAKDYGSTDITPQDINCTGCLSTKKPIYPHCLECGVRLCGLKKKVKNCGKCQQYLTCPKITNLHQHIPEAKKVSDKIRKKKN